MWRQFSPRVRPQSSHLFVCRTFSLFFVRLQLAGSSVHITSVERRGVIFVRWFRYTPRPPPPLSLSRHRADPPMSFSKLSHMATFSLHNGLLVAAQLSSARSHLGSPVVILGSAVQSAVSGLAGTYIHHKTSKTKEHFQSTHTLWVLIVLKHIIA